MDQHHLEIISCGTEWDIVRKCVCSAFFHHAAKLKVILKSINYLILLFDIKFSLC